jgi:Rieske Fe-S protein
LPVATSLPAREIRSRAYARAQLIDPDGRPVRTRSIKPDNNYLFHYPFNGTPCFLLNVGRSTEPVRLRTADQNAYHWPGGVGPYKSIVAYSAICTHRMTYPTPQISFISYRVQSTAPGVARMNTIHCCSEHSEYDPASGARVLGGPAPQPLVAILLDYDAPTDGLYAAGTLGADMYAAFFAKYHVRLELDYGSGRAEQLVTTSSVVTEMSKFCKQQVRC